jgi:trans-2,3-dihydro-3-hydroxyanthranilate isomerase
VSEQLWARRPGQDGWREYLIADVFTATPLEGNQLGVFLDARDLPAETMQRTARELNLAETVFFLPPQSGGDARVRIFTPAAELPFAGHPTLGSAFVLAGRLGKDRITVETGVGPIPVEFDPNGFGEMRQQFPHPEPYGRAADLLDALHVVESELPVETYQNGPRHVYVALPSEEAVASLKPDLSMLADHLVGVSCFAGGGTSWKTRMFAPSLGVPEDPATGSAAGPLAVHLARHGRIAYGDRIEICQGAEIARPSLLYARAEQDPGTGQGPGPERDPGTERCVAHVGGHAVIVARGEYRLT